MTIFKLPNGLAIDSAVLANEFGIHLADGLKGVYDNKWGNNFQMACDSQPDLLTTTNAGVPSYLVNYLSPEEIKILVSPMKAAQIVGKETKMGSWVDKTAQFPIMERSSEVTSYGDFNENGSASPNYNWETRESYLFQTFNEWGELQAETASAARINYIAGLNESSTLGLAKFLNKSYFFGVAGLKNYGLLNDPSLPAYISPTAGAWATLDGAGVYNDIQRLYNQLVLQGKGLIDRMCPFVLALSPESEANFTKTNIYNVNVSDQIKRNFPNLRVEVAAEYATTGGQLVQLICEEVEGQRTAECAFNEKMRTHATVVMTSGWRQKRTCGTWGTIIRQPFAIASLLGV